LVPAIGAAQRGGGHGGGGHGGVGHPGGGHPGGFSHGGAGFHHDGFHHDGFHNRNAFFFGLGFGYPGYYGGYYYPYYDPWYYGYSSPYYYSPGYYDPGYQYPAVPYGPIPYPDVCAHIGVQVPANAELWFEGEKTAQKGTNREFDSTPLTPGREYTYEIKAQWRDGDRDVSETRQVVVKAGVQVNVDFTKPAPTKVTTASSAGGV
jgi:uncharacterized protein (TIGR03000 family)